MSDRELTPKEKKQADKLAQTIKTLSFDKLLITTGFVAALKTTKAEFEAKAEPA